MEEEGDDYDSPTQDSDDNSAMCKGMGGKMTEDFTSLEVAKPKGERNVTNVRGRREE